MLFRFNIFLVAIIICVSTAKAEVTQKLNWDGLLPIATPLQHPFAVLTSSQRYDLEDLYQYRKWIKNGAISKNDAEYKDTIKLERILKSSGIDIEMRLRQYAAFVQEITKRNRSVVNELEGKLVKIPGYVVPLEMEGTGIKEFLLVPYVGACIHTPAPPPNQVVYVQLNQSYHTDKLFDPVWITGRMQIKPTTKSIAYVDGTSGVESAYVLESTQIEPYKEQNY